MIKTADQRYSDWLKDGRTTTLDRDQLYEQFMRAEIRELRAELQSQAQHPTEISKQLREYAADSGYSHNDYADTMLAAASEIERCAARLKASQVQQEPEVCSDGGKCGAGGYCIICPNVPAPEGEKNER